MEQLEGVEEEDDEDDGAEVLLSFRHEKQTYYIVRLLEPVFVVGAPRAGGHLRGAAKAGRAQERSRDIARQRSADRLADRPPSPRPAVQAAKSSSR
eukprot:2269143-Prymnesium_polylepis.1